MRCHVAKTFEEGGTQPGFSRPRIGFDVIAEPRFHAQVHATHLPIPRARLNTRGARCLLLAVPANPLLEVRHEARQVLTDRDANTFPSVQELTSLRRSAGRATRPHSVLLTPPASSARSESRRTKAHARLVRGVPSAASIKSCRPAASGGRREDDPLPIAARGACVPAGRA